METVPFIRVITVGADGVPMGLVVAKSTWVLGEDRILRPVDDPEPVCISDFWLPGDDPEDAPVRIEHDLAPAKALTDFVILGDAYAPDGRPVPSFDVQIDIGTHRRVLRVFGPRKAHFRGRDAEPGKEGRTLPTFSDPEPVTRVPMDWRQAYGGVALLEVPDTDEPLEVRSSGNPFGMGFCVQHRAMGIDGLALPQIEDPENLLTPAALVQDASRPETHPIPAGLGFFGRNWYPRVAFAGVLPQDVERTQEQARQQAAELDPQKDAETVALLNGLDPPVMDSRFFQAAAPGMQMPMLYGGEPVALRNLTPSGYLSFNLPDRMPVVVVGGIVVATDLDTVIFDVTTGRLVLTHRGRVAVTDDAGVEAFLSAPAEAGWESRG